jgi:putative FmdB family regulatory protein
MPVYNYRCQNCQHKYDVILTIAEYGSVHPSCPECKTDNVRRVISNPATVIYLDDGFTLRKKNNENSD